LVVVRTTPPQRPFRADRKQYASRRLFRKPGFVAESERRIKARYRMLLEHEIVIRVRYCETDAMGYLHHANFANYFEMGRTELLRAQGGNYRDIEKSGLYLVVVKLTCNYHAPARYDDLLTLRTKIERITAVKIEHEYRLFRGEQLLATATSVLACVDREGKVQRVPETLTRCWEESRGQTV
jgi:acyl-CoA thioester hydrolase